MLFIKKVEYTEMLSFISIIDPNIIFMQLSIIIPVFNVKNYIRKCLESVLSITDLSYEVILVQDVYADDSLEDISDLLDNSFVCICNQKNAGLSAARNAGSLLAKGEYIYFMDSDDYIDSIVFSDFFICYYPLNPDILIGTFKFVDEKGEGLEQQNNQLIFTAQGIFKGQDYLLRYLSFPMVWLYIYKRTFWLENQLEFKEGIYFEDNEFTPRALSLAQKVCVTDIPFYYYRIRLGSLARQEFGDKKMNDSLLVANSLLDFSDCKVKEKIMKSFFIKKALSVFFGPLGFFLQNHFANEEQKRDINLMLRRISLLTKLPFRFRLMLLLHRMSLWSMLYVVKKRYNYKYFHS